MTRDASTGKSSEVSIRLATPADHLAWLDLWRGYQSFYKVDIDAATTAVTWQRLLDDAEPMWCAVAQVDGKPVGLVHYLFHRSCWAEADNCYLQDLFSDAAARGKGVGTALIAAVKDAAAKRGVTNVYWMTHETNATARKLYDKVARRTGFIEYDLM